MRKTNIETILFYLIVLAYGLYALVYIYKSSFIVAGERFFVLFDDAMVSMRYAKNLAEGYGLVWNPGGELVEGYTNPLWVLMMAGFHLLPIPASKMSLVVQLSGAGFLIASLFFIRKIANFLSRDWIVPIFAVLLTAFYSPLNSWGLLGMEVSVLTLIICVSVWIGLKSMQVGQFSVWIYILLGISTLIRVDMVVPYVVILTFLVVVDTENRRQNLVWGISLLAVFLVSQTLFRLWYYGNPLPNTYYLKVEGYSAFTRIAHGLYVLFLFGWSFNWALFLLPLVIFLFRRDRSIIFVFLVFIAQVAYSVYVGGDAWEHKGGSNRYISIVMPLFFILFVYAVSLLRDILVINVQDDSQWVGRLANIGVVIFLLIAMININTLIDFKSLDRWVLLMNPEFVRGNQEYVQIAVDLEKITDSEAKIAVVSAGAIPYFSNRYAIDLLGKNDPVIAHKKPRFTDKITNLELFRPGHTKWDYDYSVGELRPDVIVQLWGDKKEVRPYLMTEYKTGRVTGEDGLYYYVLADSDHILWDMVEIKP
ncbi:hypothetical protein ACFLUC_02215 [Chloroflexota bacterium]